MHTEDLVSPITKLKEPLRFEFYAKKILTAGAVTIHKKPIVRLFQDQTGEEIKKRDWSQEIKVYVENIKKEHPVPNAGKKLNLAGKILVSISVIGILLAAAYITKAIIFDTKTVEKRKEVFFSTPQKGDLYYGVAGWEKEKYKIINGYTWSKIIEADTISNRYKLQIAVQDLDKTEHSFEPLNVDHSSFLGPVFEVSFKRRADQNDVLFVTDDKLFRFESGPLNIDYEKYKIPTSR